MKDNREILKEILNVLKEEELLDNIILVGSWAVYFYHEIFANFDLSIRTTDIDFYVPIPSNFKDKFGIIQSFRAINYDVRMDTLTNKVVFFSPDEFELEFITGLTRQQLSTVRLGNTPIYAESLPYFNLYNDKPLNHSFEGMTIRLASPGAYVLQKLLILHLRNKKTSKDVESLTYVLTYIIHQPKLLEDLKSMAKVLSKKAKRTITKNAKTFQILKILDYVT
jgi:predicted nucleotidyltransferase